MKYGHFDDKKKEYVISTPLTPLPWINYLGQDKFFSLISNLGGGYSFFQDAKLRRITRYRYNSVPNDTDGRHYYLRDGSSIWSPSYFPAKTSLDSYECHVGIGYDSFVGAKNGLKATLLCFVPLNANCEINELTLLNETDQSKTISVFGQVEFCLWNAIDDSENFQRNLSTGEVEIENGTVYHKTEYRERRNHFAFYHVGTAASHYDSDLASFLGPQRGYDSPLTVAKGVLSDSLASGWQPIGAEQIDFVLAPHESKKIVFMLGYVENDPDHKFIGPNVIDKEKAHAMMKAYDQPRQAESAFEELQKYWDGLLSIYHAETGDGKLDRMANIWNQYQCMVTFNMSRSASYFESGIGRGMGFRDSCQDLLGFVHIVPEKAKERIIDLASIQKDDGSTDHQYQPLTKKGNADVGSGFNDDPLWLIAATSAYLKETGDFSFLSSPAPFNSQTGSEKPLIDHLTASFAYTLGHIGPHGLPLIGRADWNDCLNLNCFSLTPGESFQTTTSKDTGKAESVFIAGMFVLYGREYAKILRHIGRDDEALKAEGAVAKMEQAVIDFGWDGNWYLRAYDALGHKVGSHDCIEGQIFIEPQGFCAFAEIGKEKGYPAAALQSAEKILGDDYGMELLHPCYTHYYPELGEISSYPPGYKENGSVFCHNNPWVAIADCVAGRDEEAFSLYKKNSPAYIEENSDVHMTEPYCYSQTIAGRDAPRYGQAKNSWLTGAASWSFVALSEYILGIRADYDGLIIDPHLPQSIKHATITRVFRGSRYSIEIANSKEKKTLTVNGKTISGHLIPLIQGCADYVVKVA